MENTIENKARFFAQYLEQKVLRTINQIDSNSRIVDNSWDWNHKDIYLLLKPLSSISGEDTTEIAKIIDKKATPLFTTALLCDLEEDSKILGMSACQVIKVVDFLRSKGYALPFHNLSVDQLIAYGWVKLIEP